MSPKNMKRVKTLEDDRISSLPNDLLCRVLTLLPTKHSVATTTLSTRWKNLFASVPDLNFDDSLKPSGTTNEIAFASFVYKTIFAVLTKLLYVRKFHLRCVKGTYLAALVNSWISTVSGGNLQELCVFAKNLIDPTHLPHELFYCRALTMLKLEGKFILSVPDDVIFPSLKTLKLSDLVLMDDESLKRVFNGCIVLEELRLSSCVVDSISVLEVSVASLKRLDMSDINGDYEFLLDAPRLEYFYCSSYATRGYYGGKLNSIEIAIVDIVLTYELFEDEKLSELVNMVSNARSLVLRSGSLEPLIYQTATFLNLTELRIETNWAGGWLSLPNLLRSTPFLKLLSFENGLLDIDGIFIEPAELVPVCVSAHLKEVKVGSFDGEEHEIKMVSYFLKYAKVLKKMIISPSLSFHSIFTRVGRSLTMKEYFPIARRLLKLPRHSRDCQIIFDDCLNEISFYRKFLQ